MVRLGGVRIAGMSGIWKGRDYNKHHYERLPYNSDDIKTIYHVREIDTRKLLLLKSQVDIGISHDWPRAIENHGNSGALWRMKPDFEQESKDGTLGNPAATYVMDRLRPPYWFAAHMHCKFAATKSYEDPPELTGIPKAQIVQKTSAEPPVAVATTYNADEIDLDMDDEEIPPAKPVIANGSSSGTNKGEIDPDEGGISTMAPTSSAVPSELRAQLPAAFFAHPRRQVPGQPTPPEVTNRIVRFLALDKCLPGRKFLQLLEVYPHKKSDPQASLPSSTSRSKPKFEYDPEWLAITRVFAPDIILGNKTAPPITNPGEDAYRSRIDEEQEWVDDHIVKAGRLEIPENFVTTAPIYQVGTPEIVNEGPVEYNNPQMQQFCDLVGIENKFFATEDEKHERMRNGPGSVEDRPNGRYGRGGGRGGGGRFGGRGGRGGHGRGRGRDHRAW